MKKIFFILFLLIPVTSFTQDKFDHFKMEFITQDILTSFVNQNPESLKKYISHEWLEKNEVDISDKIINNYLPQYYNILFIKENIVVAKIGSNEYNWAHLLMFVFTIEDGEYRLVPKGISDVDENYIDPWNEVSPMVCGDLDDY